MLTMRPRVSCWKITCATTTAAIAIGCSAHGTGDQTGSAGAAGTAGTSGASALGGATASGGSPTSGGTSSGGRSSGGTSSGGTSSGGASSGGTSSGGTPSGGTSSGGTGGTATGGQGGTFTTWSPTCKAGTPSAGLPSGTPALTAGVWKNISPAGLPFAGEPGSGEFGQGIAIDPCNLATLYFSTDNFDASKGGLYKSTDAGSTWNKVGKVAGQSNQYMDEPVVVRIDPGDPKHLYLGDGVRGATEGFWISTDAGETWNKPKSWTDLPASNNNFFIDDVYEVSVDPSDFKHVLVSSHQTWGVARTDYWNNSAGILESTDAGSSWIVHQPKPSWGAGHGIWFLNNSSSWLLGTQGNGYWRTTDAGATWTQVSTMDMAHGGGQIYFTKAGTVYASCGPGVMRSTDNGASWKQVGPVNFTTGILGDGKYLYAHQAYAGGAGPFHRSLETDGLTRTQYDKGGSFSDGPDELAFDSVNGILYSSNWGNGLLALKVEP